MEIGKKEIQEWMNQSKLILYRDGHKQVVPVGFLYELFVEKLTNELRGMNGEFIYRVEEEPTKKGSE